MNYFPVGKFYKHLLRFAGVRIDPKNNICHFDPEYVVNLTKSVLMVLVSPKGAQLGMHFFMHH